MIPSGILNACAHDQFKRSLRIAGKKLWVKLTTHFFCSNYGIKLKLLSVTFLAMDFEWLFLFLLTSLIQFLVCEILTIHEQVEDINHSQLWRDICEFQPNSMSRSIDLGEIFTPSSAPHPAPSCSSCAKK